MSRYPVNVHNAYHAHVYFDATTEHQAEVLWRQAQQELSFKIGRFHQQPVGPHPCGSFQILFNKKQFELLLNWLEEHRQGLSVLVHGLTGDDVKDHTDFAYWLGEVKQLKLEGLF